MPSQWQGHRQIEGTNVTTTQVSGMNGFTGGTTDSGGYFTDDGGTGLGAAFYEFVEIAVRRRPYFEILR